MKKILISALLLLFSCTSNSNKVDVNNNKCQLSSQKNIAKIDKDVSVCVEFSQKLGNYLYSLTRRSPSNKLLSIVTVSALEDGSNYERGIDTAYALDENDFKIWTKKPNTNLVNKYKNDVDIVINVMKKYLEKPVKEI
ncbi:hypothetical protein CAL7716_057510 [Calothrix sp. PCC 7716]|nr:hypothetical protein CAL7716_057510 [Calothrix sp. PCC 7716]